MLLVDSRERYSTRDKSDLQDALRKCSGSINVKVSKLEFGDVMFQGQGSDGECLVAIERKRLSDLINSMQDSRLIHQLRGMKESCDFAFLIAEATIRPGPGGEIEELGRGGWQAFYSREAGRPAVSWKQLQSFLLSLRLGPSGHDGVEVIATSNLRETAQWIVMAWHHYNDKEWEKHTTWSRIYCGDVPKKGHGARWTQPHDHNESFGPGRANAIGVATDYNHPSTVWRMASQLPGVETRAKVVAQHWRSVLNMALAGLDPKLRAEVDQWFVDNPKAARKAWEQIEFGMTADGQRKKPGFGKASAEAIVRAVFEEGA